MEQNEGQTENFDNIVELDLDDEKARRLAAQKKQEDQEKLYQAISKDYTVRGSTFYFRREPHVVAFKEKDTALLTSRNEEKISFSIVAMAEAKGWQYIQVKGHPAFRKQVWLEANLRGIDVKGYIPKEQDKEELEIKREKRMVNQVEKIDKEGAEKAEPIKPDLPPSSEGGPASVDIEQPISVSTAAKEIRPDPTNLEKPAIAISVAEKLIDKRVKDPALQQKLKEKVSEEIKKRGAEKVPDIMIYEKSKLPQKTRNKALSLEKTHRPQERSK